MRRPDDYQPTNPLALEGTRHVVRIGPARSAAIALDDAEHEYLDLMAIARREGTVEAMREAVEAHDRLQRVRAANGAAHRGEACNDDGAVG